MGHAWEDGTSLTEEHLVFLYEFFRIPREKTDSFSASNISPAELTLLHQQISKPVSIYISLCPQCGQHWKLFRWDFENGLWRVYGRTCDFTWSRGSVLMEDDKLMPLGIRGTLDEPQ